MKTNTRFLYRERGVSLFIVLIGVLTLSLAALAIIRTVDTGSLIVGNLAFRDAAVGAANRVVETTEIPWITANSGSLETSNPAQGYTKDLTAGIDATGNCTDTGNSDCTGSAKINWNDDNCGNCVANGTCNACLQASPASTANGYTSRFLIARVLGADGKGPTVKSSSGNECQRAGEVAYGGGCGTGATDVPFFRIFIKTTGPHNTVIYTEQYVHF